MSSIGKQTSRDVRIDETTLMVEQVDSTSVLETLPKEGTKGIAHLSRRRPILHWHPSRIEHSFELIRRDAYRMVQRLG